MGNGGGLLSGGSGNIQLMLGLGDVSVARGSGSAIVYGSTDHASVTQGVGKQTCNLAKGTFTDAQPLANGFDTVTGPDRHVGLRFRCGSSTRANPGSDVRIDRDDPDAVERSRDMIGNLFILIHQITSF